MCQIDRFSEIDDRFSQFFFVVPTLNIFNDINKLGLFFWSKLTRISGGSDCHCLFEDDGRSWEDHGEHPGVSVI